VGHCFCSAGGWYVLFNEYRLAQFQEIGPLLKIRRYTGALGLMMTLGGSDVCRPGVPGVRALPGDKPPI
jgi:hypothetical protein